MGATPSKYVPVRNVQVNDMIAVGGVQHIVKGVRKSGTHHFMIYLEGKDAVKQKRYQAELLIFEDMKVAVIRQEATTKS